MPATCGVAILVPEMVLYSCGFGQVDRIATPGPAISTTPPFALIVRLEKFATLKLLSMAPTAMIDGQLAGCPTGLTTPWLRLLSLPAAATIRQPRVSPAFAA